MDGVTPTATRIISTYTGNKLDPSMASFILAHPGGGPPKTTDEAERAAYYYAKAYLRMDRLREIRFLNPHITTLTLIILASLFLQWPQKTNKARLIDLLAITLSLALLFPQNLHLSLLASNLSLFYLSWTLIPGPYSRDTLPNLPDWPTLLASLPRKPGSGEADADAEEEERSDECMICWSSPSPLHPLLQLPCSHLACKPCLDLLFPTTSTLTTTNPSNPFTSSVPNPTTSSQTSPAYTCPLCRTPLALNPSVQQIFFLQKIRVALYPVATFLYGLAILYRFRRGEYWSATWPVPFLLTVGVLPLAVHVLSMREQGAAWWVEGGEREGEGERAGAEGEGGGGGGGGQPGVARGWGGKGKVPSRRSAVVLLLGVAIGVFGKWVEIAGFE
ncbi:hypothetical protein KC342_g18429 [Hortaea werneckii]|nr:hypothetical protein KC342_g18429 [Hortaea werneckii]KAI7055675.1 hypothetical protein KC339_g18344 [Hortaea werneckii]KAI7378677.1 hypothetical protein KC328_g13764 [Hortaea werneckii]